RLRVPVARGLLRRHRSRQPPGGDQDGEDARRGVRRGGVERTAARGAAVTGGALGLETIAVSKRFGALTALDDVSLKVAPGVFNALLGETGAGKSTLVKCVMGYPPADQGAVLIDGREQAIANPRDAQALGIGMVYQHFTLVPGMTVLENLALNRPDLPP